MRKLSAVVAATALTLGTGLAGAGHASALGGETFGCRFSPGPVIPFSQHCLNQTSARSYNLAFLVQNQGAGTTYTWSVPAANVSQISAGCTSTSTNCNLTVPNSDDSITVSVTLTQNGATETLSSTATVRMFCGSQLC